MQLAAMDVGTNSCRLLLAEVRGNHIVRRYRDLETTRVGKGLITTGELDAEGMKKTLACLIRWRQLLFERGVDHYRLVGTSALRDAVNGGEFAARVQEESGLTLEIISGEREAELSYTGVQKALTLKEFPLVADLGGGSTEFVCRDQEVKLRLSIPLGAVRAQEGAWGRAEFARLLEPVAVRRQELAPYPLIMVGGTATSLAAIDQEMTEYDAEKIQGYRLTRSRVSHIYNHLVSLTLEERKHLPGLLPDRADIMPWGVAIILAILEALERQELLVADSDLLDALIYEMLPIEQ